MLRGFLVGHAKRREVTAEQIGVTRNDRQRVVHLVHHAGREHAGFHGPVELRQFLPEIRIGLFQRADIFFRGELLLAPLHAFIEHLADREHIEGLVKVIRRAEPHRRAGGLDGFVTREHDAFGIGIDFLQLAQDIHARQVRHLDVENGGVHGVRAGVLNALTTAGGDDALITVFENNPQRFARAGLIIHDQQSRFLRRLGWRWFCRECVECCHGGPLFFKTSSCW